MTQAPKSCDDRSCDTENNDDGDDDDSGTAAPSSSSSHEASKSAPNKNSGRRRHRRRRRAAAHSTGQRPSNRPVCRRANHLNGQARRRSHRTRRERPRYDGATFARALKPQLATRARGELHGPSWCSPEAGLRTRPEMQGALALVSSSQQLSDRQFSSNVSRSLTSSSAARKGRQKGVRARPE